MSSFSTAVGPSSTGTGCQNHPEVNASDRCAGCAEAFCSNCIVEMQGQKYCGQCKVMGLKAQPQMERPSRPCLAANNAMTMALVGIIGMFCLGILGSLIGLGLEIGAIVKGAEAKRQIAADPQLKGTEKAGFGMSMGIIMTATYVVLLLAMAMKAAR